MTAHTERVTAGSVGLDRLTEIVSIDRGSPVPLYAQVAKCLERAIEEGRLPPGTRLDNEIRIAAELAVSRPTIRRALEHLVSKGLIVRRRGIGTRVVQRRVRRPLELTSLFDDLAASGQRPTTAVLALDVHPAEPPVAQVLGLAEGVEVFGIVRLRSAFDQPLARMTNYLPASLPGLSDMLTREALTRHGLYQVLAAGGIHLHAANQSIGARRATAGESRLLNEPMGGALLTMQRVAFDDHGRAVEYGTHVYAATRYTFELTLLSP